MGLAGALRLPGRVLGELVSRAVPARTGTWTTDGRVHVAVPGLGRPEATELRQRLADRLSELPGVAWVAVNAVLERVVVGLDDPPASTEDIERRVGKVLDEDGNVDTQGIRASRPEPPDDRGPLTRTLATLVADAAGLAVATTGRFAWRIPGATEAAAVITLVDTQPKLRGGLERLLGKETADTVIGVGNAAAQAVAGGYAGLGVDTALRVAQLAEVRQRMRCWTEREPRLLGSREAADAPPVAPRRPKPLPDGPVETYAPRTAAVAVAGTGVALATGNATRAAGIALATLPKAAGAGREMFACVLGHVLARRGVVVLDRAVLRKLDRVDTVVLDADALTTGRLVVADVLPLPEVDGDEAQTIAYTLFDEAALDESIGVDGWRLGPVDALGIRGRTGAREQRRLRTAGAVAVLGLARGHRLAAVLGVRPEPAQAADALVAAARRAGLHLVYAHEGPLDGREVGARRVPGGGRLATAVQELQADGHGVLLVSRNRPALGQADCGVGVDGRDGTPAWGAHVLVGTDLDSAALLIEATGTAGTVSRRGVVLAEAGSALGAVTTMTGRPTGAGGRALLAVNGAAALSLVQGGWAAAELARRPLSPPVSTTPWHLLPADKVLEALDVGPDGLSTRDARRRFRPDAQTAPPRTGFARAFAEELANPLTPILAGGAALSAAIGSVIDAGVVVGAAGLGAFVGGLQRTLTDRAVADLLARSAVVATVRRDGATVRIAADELAVGDVIELGPDDVVPADCRLLEADGLELDESSLTGESFPVAKTVTPVVASGVADRASMVYEGTTVAAGRAVAVVVATGAGTEAGRSMATAQRAAPVSGVEARLAQITRTTLPIALGSAGAVVAAGLLRGRPIRQTLGSAVGLAVASVPEGLPFLVSAAQLAAARRLSREGALVRNARTIEALGRVDVLCFDKTGTLTQGRIRLAAVSDGHRQRELDDIDGDLRTVVAAALRATPNGDGPLPHLTDRSIVDGAASAGIGADTGRPGWRPLAVLPFEPSRGYHATLAEHSGSATARGSSPGGLLLSVKGAPETVLPRCHADASGRPLGAAGHRRLRTALNRLTGLGHRVLAVAERDTDRTELTEHDVNHLRFLGFLALADPVRTTAGASLRSLHAAGAHVMMITGDHPNTASTIAEELGILNGHRVVTGTEIDGLDDDALDALLPNVAVVARSTPAHKVRVVQAFQRLGKLVAMTGDGANDAPAIRLADVGIALGRRGTPAARAAADLVVTDDRLETIISALVEGRAMWRSVRQALAILVGGNLGEIGFTVFGSVVTGTSPLNARQLLLVNLLTDLAPALAIALRRPDVSPDNLLSEGPQTSLGSALTKEVALRAGATAFGASSGWLLARFTGTETRARTVALASLVGTQLGQTVLLGARSPAVLGASLGSAAALVAVIQTPGVSQFFGCTPLGPVGWSIAAGSATAAAIGSAVLPRLTGQALPGVPR